MKLKSRTGATFSAVWGELETYKTYLEVVCLGGAEKREQRLPLFYNAFVSCILVRIYTHQYFFRRRLTKKIAGIMTALIVRSSKVASGAGSLVTTR
jgi:hypothetical protein